MYQRQDGIVDINHDRCIGCKACMQACPYDSIYIDPEDGTAAKCHYCAHRTEIGLEPACVVVCPEHAIIAGDLDSRDSEISQLIAREPVRVRNPEQGTRPKLYYIDAEESAIVPTAARHEATYMWAQRNMTVHGGGAHYLSDSPLLQRNALATYDVAHARPWGWQVPAYSWTKAIASGALLFPAVAELFGRIARDRIRDIALSSVALLFMALTTGLLVWDLEYKSRFLRVVFTPQKKSWLARGAFILIGYSALAGLYWIGAVLGVAKATALLLWPTLLAGILAAVYTAFLFGQCEGRDLWQTPLLPVHLVVRAFLCGAAVLALLPDKLGGSADSLALSRIGLICGLVGHLVIVGTEFLMPHSTDNAAYAARLITHGPFKPMFWFGSVVVGGVVPLLVLVSMNGYVATATASVFARGGLLAFEWCFVMAGQAVPNS